MVKGQMAEAMEELNIRNVTNLLAILKNAFGDRDNTSTAGRELYQLRQGKEDFATEHADLTPIVGKL